MARKIKATERPRPDRVSEIWDRAERLARVNKAENATRRGINKIVKDATRVMGDGTEVSGYTALRMQQKPLARLIEAKKIGPQELQAASEIETAFMAMTDGLRIKPPSMEKLDRGKNHTERGSAIDAQQRYRSWAQHWSMLAKRGDRTLEVVIAVVIDERCFRIVGYDLGIHHKTVKLACIRGLRDYAARAGWVEGKLAAQWKAEAGMTFKAWHPELSAAIARAQVSRSGPKDAA